MLTRGVNGSWRGILRSHPLLPDNSGQRRYLGDSVATNTSHRKVTPDKARAFRPCGSPETVIQRPISLAARRMGPDRWSHAEGSPTLSITSLIHQRRIGQPSQFINEAQGSRQLALVAFVGLWRFSISPRVYTTSTRYKILNTVVACQFNVHKPDCLLSLTCHGLKAISPEPTPMKPGV